MGGEDDKHHARIVRDRAAHQKRHGEDRGNVNDSPLLHPGNEGHDRERKLDRLEHWATEERADGPDARRLREMAGGAEYQGGPVGAERFVEQPPPGPHGAPYNQEKHARERHTRGGEAGKHPHPREETTPEPGRGAHAVHTATNEPPDITRGPGGLDYEHGKRNPSGRRGGGT